MSVTATVQIPLTIPWWDVARFNFKELGTHLLWWVSLPKLLTIDFCYFSIGPPPAPNPVLVLQDTFWDPVFSWPDYPITGYRVTLLRSNAYGGQQLLDQILISTSINKLLHYNKRVCLGIFLKSVKSWCSLLVLSMSLVKENREASQEVSLKWTVC